MGSLRRSAGFGRLDTLYNVGGRIVIKIIGFDDGLGMTFEGHWKFLCWVIVCS